MSQKISQFIKILSVDASGLLTVVQNGQNFTITQADYLATLGVTGSIEQEGAVTGTPILDIDGTVNKIRNVEDGPGILSSVSPENGLTLQHNFTADTVGAPLLLNPTAASPTFPSLIGSSSIAVEQVGEQVKFELTSAPVSTSTVIINEIADFPTAVSGVITLADDTDYFLTNSMTTADRFVLGVNSQIRAVSTVITTLTYTGTAAMFSCEDCNIRMRNITFVAANAASSFYNITSSTSAGIGIVFSSNVVYAGATMGEMSCRIFSLISCGVVLSVDGLNITGTTMETLSLLQSNWFQSAGTCVDLNSTVFSSAETSNLFVNYDSGVTFLSGLAGSGNIASGGQGTVFDCKFIGLGTPLNNIDPDDDLWQFVGSNKIRDTIRDGLISIQSNTTETVIASIGVAVKAAGTFTVGRNSGYTPDTTGLITYDLAKDVVAPVNVSVTVIMASGGAKDVRACVAVNGSPIADSSIGTSVSSSLADTIPLSWQLDLSQTDTVEVQVQNDTDTTNIIVVDMTLVVN